MSGLSRFSAANSLFKPRSGRVSGLAQQAANRANDSGSMRMDDGIPTMNPRRAQRAQQNATQATGGLDAGGGAGLDEVEMREYMPQRAADIRHLRFRAYSARQAGNHELSKALEDELRKVMLEQRSDVRALNPRGTTADDLNAASERLPGMFRESALGAAGAARGDADRIGGQIDTYNQRIGEGRLRAMGFDAAGERNRSVTGLGDTQIGPAAMSRFGSMVSPAERGTVDPTLAGGVDVRQGLMDRRRAALDSAAGFEQRAERGFTPSEFDAEALAARIGAEDEAARQRAMEAQRKRFVMQGNRDADFYAGDRTADAFRGADVLNAETGLTTAQTNARAAQTALTEENQRGNVVRDRGEGLLRLGADVTSAKATADIAEARQRAVNADLDRSKKELELKGLSIETDGATLMARSPEVVQQGTFSTVDKIIDSFTQPVRGEDGSIKNQQRGVAAGIVKPGQLDGSAVSLMSSTWIPKITEAYESGDPVAKQEAMDMATILYGQLEALRSQTASGSFELRLSSGVLGSLGQILPLPGGISDRFYRRHLGAPELTADQQNAQDAVDEMNRITDVLGIIATGGKTPGAVRRDQFRLSSARANAGL